MFESWRDHDWHDEDAATEPQWSAELSFGDPDAWRGADADPADDAWRGDQPVVQEWPEWDAGPEYQMWKRRAEDER